MSLHSIIEPAGTLLTGWKLVPARDCHAADSRNDDDIPLDLARAPAPAENAPRVVPASRWEADLGRKR
ncbi:hypothetical protein ACFOD9_09615 [Novosphingobium bradum]|uniref:Uncharacterized protein n=1 Tax=Novosphingobium bradum TaxID=1737444 RepID=A0ABV7IP90_9SPHN